MRFDLDDQLMQTVKLTPYDKTLVGKYTGKEDVTVICDSSAAAFSVVLPDASVATCVRFSILNIGDKVVTLEPPTGQYLNDVWFITLKQWDCVSVIPVDKKWYIIDKKTNRFGSEANYTEFENTGFMKLVGDARGYDDIIIGVAAGKVPAVNYPDWTPFTTNLSAYAFKVDDKIDLATIELLHDSEENQTVYTHIHWATNGTNIDNRYVKFRIYYTFAKDGTVFPDDQYIESDNILIPANTAHRTSFMSNIGIISLLGFGIGTQIKTGIRRVAATTGTAPTSAPFVGQVGIHRRIDTPSGSRTITTK